MPLVGARRAREGDDSPPNGCAMEEDSAGSIYLAFTTATQAARAARLIGRFSPPAWLAKRQFASNRPATARNTCAMLVCYTQAPTGTNWSSSVMLNIFK